MRKLFSILAAMLVAVAVSADPVVLPATLDVTNVSFRSEGMPDFIVDEGQDYAGTYFDMGAHDSSNDTLLYAEWDVTIEPLNYYVTVDVYNTNSWTVQFFLLNQAGETLKELSYHGHSGDKGQFAAGSLDLRDLAAGNYKFRARSHYAWSALKLKDVIFEADYSGANVDLPGTLLPAYAELSTNASLVNGALAFKPSTANNEYANWNVSFAEAGTYNVTIDITASNGHNYGVELIGEDEETSYGAVNEGGQVSDTGVKTLGTITVPAAGNYIVHLTNAIQWSEAVLNSITFAAPEPQVLYFKPGVWNIDGAKFAVWDITNSKWTAFMTLAENETDVYTTTVDANVQQVIFVRLNSAVTEPKWNSLEEPENVWNQTADLTLEENKDLYTMTDWSAGAWSKYEYVVPAKFYITGDENLVGEDKAWHADAIKATEDAYTFENLAAGSYKLKVVVNDAWIGYDALTADYKAAELYPDQDGNVCFKLAEAGNVTVTYTNEVFKVEGAFVPALVQLIGIQGEGEAAWDASINAVDLTPAEDHLTTSVTLPLEGWYYEFKVLLEGAWLGKENEEGMYNIKNDWNWVDGLTYAGGNIKLTMGDGDQVPGNYIFTYEYATGKLTVTFPNATAISDTNAEVKAVKTIENGQLVIIKNGIRYNAQGTCF